MSEPIKIDQPIVGVGIVEDKPALKPYDRPVRLRGTTYKIKPSVTQAALYLTINDIELPDGKRPFEVFINTKDRTHDEFITALTRLVSAVCRMPLPFDFIIEELKEVAATDGSYFLPSGDPAGHGRVKGIVNHIGRVLEEHCIAAGMIQRRTLSASEREVVDAKVTVAKARGMQAQPCPKCGQVEMYLLDGCLTCRNCGESKCG